MLLLSSPRALTIATDMPYGFYTCISLVIPQKKGYCTFVSLGDVTRVFVVEVEKLVLSFCCLSHNQRGVGCDFPTAVHECTLEERERERESRVRNLHGKHGAE